MNQVPENAGSLLTDRSRRDAGTRPEKKEPEFIETNLTVIQLKLIPVLGSPIPVVVMKVKQGKSVIRLFLKMPL